MPPVLAELRNVSKVYRRQADEVWAVRDVSLQIQAGELISVIGSSGSGKSTILHILGMLDRPTQGSYAFQQQDVSGHADHELSRLRNRTIGFIFQAFHLLPQLSTLENVELPLLYSGLPAAVRRERCLKMLARVNLSHRVTHRPSELSGGEMQRTVIARALTTEPALLLADEPTGNLDRRNGEAIFALLQELHAEGRTLVIVTHNPELAQRTERVIRMSDGQVVPA